MVHHLDAVGHLIEKARGRQARWPDQPSSPCTARFDHWKRMQRLERTYHGQIERFADWDRMTRLAFEHDEELGNH